MSESLALVEPGRPMLDYLPIGLFGSVMGVTSLSVAWRLAHVRSPEGIALTIAAVAVVAFVLMVAGYTIKLVTAFDAVREVRSAAPYFLSQPT